MNNIPTEPPISVEEMWKFFIKHRWMSVFVLSTNSFTISFLLMKYLHTVYFISSTSSVRERFVEAVIRRWSVKKSVPKTFARFTEKHLCQKVFSCEFCEILYNTFFKERLWWLFLDFQSFDSWVISEMLIEKYLDIKHRNIKIQCLY